jgi:hypothetical protein
MHPEEGLLHHRQLPPGGDPPDLPQTPLRLPPQHEALQGALY